MAATQLRLPVRTLRIQVARQPSAMLLAAVVSLVIAGLLAFIDTPSPVIHDEFSYLLAADTFLNGRLSNEAHPHWKHFESFHIIQRPTYASKYQPLPGALLAFGQLLVGHPIAGVCVGAALMAACGCWMLGGWLPNRWALFGGLLIALHPALQFTWGHGYWGGAVPFIGGALLFGAWPRIRTDLRTRDAIILGLGLAILAGSRPFEGFLAGCCVLLAMAKWFLGRNRPSLVTVVRRLFLPCGTMLGLFFAFMVYYNVRTTGSAWEMPYRIHENEYAVSPWFLWQSVNPTPEYRHKEIQNYFTGWAFRDYQRQQTWAGWLKANADGFATHWRFYLGYLTLPLLIATGFIRRPKLRLAWCAIAVALLASTMVPWKMPHYLAPVAPLIFLLIVYGFRYARALCKRSTICHWIAPSVLLLQLCVCIGLLHAHRHHDPLPWCQVRDRIESELARQPQKDLIIVHYSKKHNRLEYGDLRLHFEWVYNKASIDEAEVVWARAIDRVSDQKLQEYFATRRVWHFWPDDSYELRPVGGEESPAGELQTLIPCNRKEP